MTLETRDDVEVLTLGCRLNIVESDLMRVAATAAGHKALTIVNTCAVTAEAARQARQTIRRLKRDDPDRTVVVTGCASEIDGPRFGAMPEIDHVLGNRSKTDPAVWAALPGAGQPPASLRAVPGGLEPKLSHTRGFLEVQNGCDHRCTFCVIPFGRGESRSVPIETVLGRARLMLEQGRSEIVLTGVDLTAYGLDLPDQPRLGDLVRGLLAGLPQLARLRLSSIDCVEADPLLLDVLATEPRLMPHLHLSLQSGSDLILKRMKRRHGRQDAVRFCQTVRAARPDMVFGADLIVGFPTESEQDFADSMALVADCGITHLHVFPYSARPGTPAARMPAVAQPLIKARADRLRACGEVALLAHLDRQIGRDATILMERGGRGRMEDFTAVRVAEPAEPGCLIRVRIEAHDGRQLAGRRLAA